ncbi:VOC family protein, partial [Leisingera sp. SS27]|uniref:VOC family protein n=1 Tax=Leisingera sp. SS27 TaxID=2979462 RepID=UPI00232B0273
MLASKTGRIVWHDLFTPDRTRAMDFYRQAAGWRYQTEQAADFAWGGGEKAFVLALLDGEAGAGFAETPPGLQDGWIPYAEVSDVDAAAAQAEDRGGDILRSPFEVPGVGRNALLRDPLGALLGISLSRHSFPAPARQFGPEIYLSNGAGFPAE